MSSIDQQFVEYIVKSLVSKPEAVVIERRIDEKGVLLELTVDPEDLGRVIGKRGATAQSLRTLLRALGTKNDARYNLKIVDNGEPGFSGSNSSSGGHSDDAQADDNSGDASGPSHSQAANEPAATSQSADDDDDFPSRPTASASSVVDKTRKELEELDDLDV
ncbi:MAG TPA: KH domain-containing protein [Candidatus Saccharimonadales bacterium]|nr:KH domain-containing protein [Candidatus Saccharimonadales bacterium]